MENKKIKKNIWFEIFDWLGTILMVGLAILSFIIFLNKVIIKNPKFTIFGFSTYYIDSGSMDGTINEGDIIITKNKKVYEIGDIVTFAKDGDRVAITHRIIDITKDGKYVTKGDANTGIDEITISKNNIIGKVIKVIPDSSSFFKWLTVDGGIIFVLLAIVVIILIIMVLRKKE